MARMAISGWPHRVGSITRIGASRDDSGPQGKRPLSRPWLWTRPVASGRACRTALRCAGRRSASHSSCRELGRRHGTCLRWLRMQPVQCGSAQMPDCFATTARGRRSTAGARGCRRIWCSCWYATGKARCGWAPAAALLACSMGRSKHLRRGKDSRATRCFRFSRIARGISGWERSPGAWIYCGIARLPRTRRRTGSRTITFARFTRTNGERCGWAQVAAALIGETKMASSR